MNSNAHLCSGYGVVKTIHLPEVPRNNLGGFIHFGFSGARSPTIHMVFAKRLKNVDARNEKVVALILKAVRRTQRVEGTAYPFLACLGFLGHDAKLPV